jgi:hypothetical protein
MELKEPQSQYITYVKQEKCLQKFSRKVRIEGAFLDMKF